MRRVLTILLISAVTLGISSCRKFLEQSSQDLIRPLSVEHYKELLQGESYFKDLYKNGWFVDMMTDDIATIDLGYPTKFVNTTAERIKYAYQWGPDLEDPTGTFTDNLFKTLYKNILTANACIMAIDELKGTEAERKVLKGQAHFTRAYGYFILANLYAQAYNEANENDLCVPIIFNTTPTLNGYNRATIKEVWNLISTDITTAVASLKDDKVSRSSYEINYKAALLLASRIFLYQEDYEKAITYGEQFMQMNPSLKDITAIISSPNPDAATKDEKAFLYPATNPEILFTFGRLNNNLAEGGYLFYSRGAVGVQQFSFSASKNAPASLMDSYTSNDKRKTHWFAQPTGAPGLVYSYPSYSPMKVNTYDLCRTSQAMRSAEVYLNLAEAYARKAAPDPVKSISLLNQLRSKRITGYTQLTGTNFPGPTSLVSFILEERRRELCFEEFHRWWDLRRTGQPALQHNWLNEVYKLNQKDPAYVLNFPKAELEFNPGLIPNNRPQRNPQ